LANQYQYRTNIYFVANNDNANDGIPTLKRAELGLAGNSFSIVPLVEGVENLQIEYGLDTGVPTTGTPAVYNAQSGQLCPVCGVADQLLAEHRCREDQHTDAQHDHHPRLCRR